MDDHDFGTSSLSSEQPHQQQSQNPAQQPNDEQNVGGEEEDEEEVQERRIVSIIIDEDEDLEDEDGELNTSADGGGQHDQEQTEALYGDHNYILIVDHPKPPDSRPFPEIKGITIDEKDDSNQRTLLIGRRNVIKQPRMLQPQQQQQFDDPTYGNGYQQRQQRMMKAGSGGQIVGTAASVRYSGQTPPQQPQQFSSASPYSLRQSLQRSPDPRNLSTNLRPASLTRGRRPIANLDSPYGMNSGIRIGHSLPPPQQQHHQMRRQSNGEMMEEEGGMQPQEYEDFQQQQQMAAAAVPAPMVVPARGRQTAGSQRGGHNKNRRGRGGGRIAADYAPPPPGKTLHTYSTQRKPTTKRQTTRIAQLEQRRAEQKQRELEMEIEEEQEKTFLEQEEQLNEAFMQRREGKKAASTGKSPSKRPRSSPRKAAASEKTVPPADPTHPTTAAIDQDSSKPPDDPFLPPQQQMLLPLQRQGRASHHPQYSSHTPFDSSALDGTINAVIRGEASVMQQHFGPPLTPGGQHYYPQSPPPQFHQQQQSPYKMQQHQGAGMPPIGSRRQYLAAASSMGSSPPSGGGPLSNQRLNDLAELAHASANLLEQTTSRVVSFQQQQQQFIQPQSSKTLHFKVVQTSHQDQEFEQDYATHPPQQQVFMVQQRTDQYAQHISAIPTNTPQHPSAEVKTAKKQQRRSVPKKQNTSSTAVFEEEQPEMMMGMTTAGFGQGDEMMPGTSAAATIGEPKMMKKSGGGKFYEQQIGRQQMMESIGDGNGRQIVVGMEMAGQEMGGEMGAEETKPKRERKKRQQKEMADAMAAYETRCICGMTHNDPFMIQCDKCDVWQHGICMGITQKNVPDEYLCEQCNPRKLKLSAKAAASAQQRALKLLEAQKRTRKIAANLKRKSAPAEMPHKSSTKALLGIRQGKVMKKSLAPAPSSKLSKSFSSATEGSAVGGGLEGTSATAIGGVAVDFEETNENGYSRGVRSYSRSVHSLVTKMQPFVLGEIGLLKQLEKISKARPMLVTPQHKGLVATQGKTPIPPGMPIIEYVGQVSLLNEVKALAPKKPINHEFTVIYSGLDERVLIDATKKGSMARFVRRSCRPNATMQHAIIDGKLRFYLYATTNIENSTEITIPFDYDYRHESTVPVECACGQNVYMNGAEHYCPVADFNKSLQTKGGIEQSQSGSRRAGGSPTRATRQASAAMAIGGGSSPKSVALVKEEMKSGANSPAMVGTESEGRQLRARNQPSKSEHSAAGTPPQHGRATRSSTSNVASTPKELEKTISAAAENENVANKRKSRDLKPASSSYSDFLEAPQPTMPVVNFSQSHPMQASAMTIKSQAKLSTISPSPTPKKRGRPSAAAKETAAAKEETKDKSTKKPKIEPTEGGNANLSREERKMQQTIDAYERAEQKKKRQSDDQQIKTEAAVSPKKARISSAATSTSVRKSKSATSTTAEIFTEFGDILRENLNGIQRDFELPADFNKLRTKLTQQSQIQQQQRGRKVTATTAQPTPSKSAPFTTTTTMAAAMPKKQLKESTAAAVPVVKESPRKSAAAKPTVPKKEVKTEPAPTTTTSRVSKLQLRREREQAEAAAAAEAASKLKEAAVPIGRSQAGMGMAERRQQSKGALTTTSGPIEKEKQPSKGTKAEGKPTSPNEQATVKEAQEMGKEMSTTTESAMESSIQQQQLAAELAARVPNTKAQKKLTIEEYKRKKMADIEAKKCGGAGGISSGEGATKTSQTSVAGNSGMAIGSAHSTGLSASTPPTRQSPRKSFIPTVGAAGSSSAAIQSSPPQQLEDFTPSPPIIVSGGRRPLYSTPSLDELKKRILTGSGGSSSSGGSASRSGADTSFAQQLHSTSTTASSSSYFPIDPLPPPPPPQYPKRGGGTASGAAAGVDSGATDRGSLDERLKRFVTKRERGGN